MLKTDQLQDMQVKSEYPNDTDSVDFSKTEDTRAHWWTLNGTPPPNAATNSTVTQHTQARALENIRLFSLCTANLIKMKKLISVARFKTTNLWKELLLKIAGMSYLIGVFSWHEKWEQGRKNEVDL